MEWDENNKLKIAQEWEHERVTTVMEIVNWKITYYAVVKLRVLQNQRLWVVMSG